MTDIATSHRPAPEVTDRPTWQARLEELREAEKAHTRAGDALAARRRRLPMVEVDARTTLVGVDGPVPLVDVFDGRSQLIAYLLMWHAGQAAARQCEGCTFNVSHVTELAYLHSRGVSYAVFCQGPFAESARYHGFMGWTVPWFSVPPQSAGPLHADPRSGDLICFLRDGGRVFETYRTSGRGNEVMTPSYGLLDRTAYGRQETWEDSPDGWPQSYAATGSQMTLDGRPTAQWPRIRAGHDDDLDQMEEPS